MSAFFRLWLTGWVVVAALIAIKLTLLNGTPIGRVVGPASFAFACFLLVAGELRFQMLRRQ